ncbi:protein of unknown function (plasmid) [Paraburkholderia kururiensis]|uniref:hypothetical protein n=1 Tax=Paraburkholderia kururiensis TaxID=984307 RepID=UPI0039A74964
MGEWIKVSEYCLSHPDGWTIAKCYVQGVAHYVLWHGDTRKDQFSEVRDAMREHSRLTRTSQASTDGFGNALAPPDQQEQPSSGYAAEKGGGSPIPKAGDPQGID